MITVGGRYGVLVETSSSDTPCESILAVPVRTTVPQRRATFTRTRSFDSGSVIVRCDGLKCPVSRLRCRMMTGIAWPRASDYDSSCANSLLMRATKSLPAHEKEIAPWVLNLMPSIGSAVVLASSACLLLGGEPVSSLRWY